MTVVSKFNYGPAAGVFIPFLTSALGCYISRSNIGIWFPKKLRKPAWCPPNCVFGPIWAMLYASMGYSSYLVYKDGGGFDGIAKIPLLIYGIQLCYGSVWIPLLSESRKIALSLMDVIALDLGIGATIFTFSTINETAARLLYPYFGWCLFKSVLTAWIHKHN